MRRIYFDQDGTLAGFRNVPISFLYLRGYFLFLRPHRNILKAMKILHEMEDTEVYVLTSVLKDHPTARREKLSWLRVFAPYLPAERIIFVPCGSNKADYVSGPEDAVLIDDYGVNVRAWPGEYVKVSRDKEDFFKERTKHIKCIHPGMEPEEIVNVITEE